MRTSSVKPTKAFRNEEMRMPHNDDVRIPLCAHPHQLFWRRTRRSVASTTRSTMSRLSDLPSRAPTDIDLPSTVRTPQQAGNCPTIRSLLSGPSRGEVPPLQAESDMRQFQDSFRTEGNVFWKRGSVATDSTNPPTLGLDRPEGLVDWRKHGPMTTENAVVESSFRRKNTLTLSEQHRVVFQFGSNAQRHPNLQPTLLAPLALAAQQKGLGASWNGPAPPERRDFAALRPRYQHQPQANQELQSAKAVFRVKPILRAEAPSAISSRSRRNQSFNYPTVDLQASIEKNKAKIKQNRCYCVQDIGKHSRASESRVANEEFKLQLKTVDAQPSRGHQGGGVHVVDSSRTANLDTMDPRQQQQHTGIATINPASPAVNLIGRLAKRKSEASNRARILKARDQTKKHEIFMSNIDQTTRLGGVTHSFLHLVENTYQRRRTETIEKGKAVNIQDGSLNLALQPIQINIDPLDAKYSGWNTSQQKDHVVGHFVKTQERVRMARHAAAIATDRNKEKTPRDEEQQVDENAKSKESIQEKKLDQGQDEGHSAPQQDALNEKASELEQDGQVDEAQDTLNTQRAGSVEQNPPIEKGPLSMKILYDLSEELRKAGHKESVSALIDVESVEEQPVPEVAPPQVEPTESWVAPCGLIKGRPKELIAMLDETLKIRPVQLSQAIIADAQLEGYNVDAYKAEAVQFIENALDSSFPKRTGTLFQKLAGNKTNCVLQNMDVFSRLDFSNGTNKAKLLHAAAKAPKRTSKRVAKAEIKDPRPSGMQAGMCTHDFAPAKDLKQQIYDQFKSYWAFCKALAPDQNTLRRADLVASLCQHILTKPDLSPLELEIFSDSKNAQRLLFDPLMHLVAADVREEQKLEQLGDPRIQNPVSSKTIDNSNQSKWRYNLDIASFRHPKDPTIRNLSDTEEPTQEDPDEEAIAEGKTGDRYAFTLNAEAHRYVMAIYQAFKDSEDKGQTLFSQHVEAQMEQIRSRSTNQGERDASYSNAFEDFRKAYMTEELLVNSAPLKPAPRTLEHPEQEGIQKPKKGKIQDEGESMRLLTFLERLYPILKRYHEKKVAAKSSLSVYSEDPHSQRTRRVPRTYTAMLTQNAGQLSQTKQDILVDQEKTQKLFYDRVKQQEFYNCIEKCKNGKIANDEEQVVFGAYQGFQEAQSVPWPVFKKIQNQKLTLLREPLSATDAMVLGNYLSQSAKIITSNIRVLEIKNCCLSNQSMLVILTGIAAQRRISSINIFNEGIDYYCMERLTEIVSRPPPYSLTELQLVGCKNMPPSAMLMLLQSLEAGSNLAKLTLSNFKLLPGSNSDETEETQLLGRYLLNQSATSDASTRVQPLTHLSLSYLNLTPSQLCRVMFGLRENANMQFLDLAGNKLQQQLLNSDQSSHLKGFNNHLNSMIEHSGRNLTHLDLSDMVALDTKGQLCSTTDSLASSEAFTDQLDLPRLLTTITTHSQSLQVLHLNRNHLSRGQKLEVAMHMGMQRYPKDQAVHQEISESFNAPDEAKLEAFVKKNYTDHLLGSRSVEHGLRQRLLDDEMQKRVQQDAVAKADQSLSGPNNDRTFSTLLHNSFTLYRDLNSSANDVLYRATTSSESHGVACMQPCLGYAEEAQKWVILDEEMVGGPQEGLSSDPYECCKFCARLQHVHLYLNFERKEEDDLEDREAAAADPIKVEGFQVIRDPEIVKILKLHVLKMRPAGEAYVQSIKRSKEMKSSTELVNPLAFGSFSAWKPYEMLPTQIYTLRLLKDQLVKNVGKDHDEPFDDILFESHLQKILHGAKRKQYWSAMRAKIPDLAVFLDHVQTEWQFEHMRKVNQFNRPTQHSSSWCTEPQPAGRETPVTPKAAQVLNQESYILPILTKPGKHSVIVYVPEHDIFCCQNIVVDSVRGQYGCGPSTEYPQQCAQQIQAQQEYDPFKIDIFAEQRIEKQKNLKLTLLKDLQPARVKVLHGLERIPASALHLAAQHYGGINDLFMQLVADTISGTGDDSLEAAAPALAGSTKFYPHASTTRVAEYFSKSEPSKKMFIDRHQFVQYVLKQIVKEPKMAERLNPKPVEWFDPSDKYRNLTQFRQYFDQLDLETVCWIERNMRVFTAMFSKSALGGQLFENEGRFHKHANNLALSYRSLGFMSLQNLQATLEIGSYADVLRMRCALGYNPDYFGLDDRLSYNLASEKARADVDEHSKKYAEEQKERERNYFEESTRERDRKPQKTPRSKEPGSRTHSRVSDDAEGARPRSSEQDNNDSRGADDEVLEMQKKIEERYKFSRQRCFNVDFMEFIQIIIIQAVILQQPTGSSQRASAPPEQQEPNQQQENAQPEEPQPAPGTLQIKIPEDIPQPDVKATHKPLKLPGAGLRHILHDYLSSLSAMKTLENHYDLRLLHLSDSMMYQLNSYVQEQLSLRSAQVTPGGQRSRKAADIRNRPDLAAILAGFCADEVPEEKVKEQINKVAEK